MHSARTSYKLHLKIIFLIVVLLAPLLLIINKAKAAALTETFVMFNRMEVSTQTTGTVCATQTTSGTDTQVEVTFPTGYTLGAAGTFTVNTTNTAWPSGATAWPGIGTASNVTGQVVTFPSTTLTVAVLYCFNWINASAVETQSSASNSNSGTIGTYSSGPTLIDSGTYVTSTITNDQISVTASVPSAFSFALSGNTDPLGSLVTSAVSSSPTPRTVTINTNARNGWIVWAKDANTGLESTSNPSATIASTTPGSNSTLTAGTQGYNMGVTQTQSTGTGTITVATPFIGGSDEGGGLNTTYATIASSNGTGGSSVLTLTNNVAISAITPAATDYADTITVVGAGEF